MSYPQMPKVPYGAVYFRKSNPPREHWERDYATAAEDGINIFRHWFMWSAIETSPGVYDWDDYDRQLELGDRFGIKTIIAEMITAVPEWLYHERPEGRYRRADGTAVPLFMGGSSATGGFPGMTLDDPVVHERAEAFLTALVERYRGHPSLGGYDLWNECNYPENSGFAPATLSAFRDWLKAKYGSIEALGKAWGRYSLARWDYVEPPRTLAAYADSHDWLQFLSDNAYKHLRWRVELVRRLDPDHLITAHGMAASLVGAANIGSDDWRAAAEVDLYGVTWVASRQGDKPYQHIHAMDLTRAAARGKPFWHAESQAGPLWLQPQVIGRPLEDGRVTSPSDVRIWNLTSFAGGAAGLLCPRWRPLLDGPLFGAFGSYGMDGTRTDRSDMASSIARWTAANADVFEARPVRGEVGLVYVPETQFQEYLLNGAVRRYTDAVRGAYQGFFANNVQADFVHLDDIDGYDVLYLPYPYMLNAASAERLAAWVEAGGRLISEGLPGYFGAHGHVGQVQPNFGLDRVFGARETDVVFAPDILGDLRLTVLGHRIEGGGYFQTYRPEGGSAVGHYDDGRVAAVENSFGKGRALLVGTYPGLGYFTHHSEGGRQFFRHLLDWAGTAPQVTTSNSGLIARLHRDGTRRVLWVLNPTRQGRQARIGLAGSTGSATVRWGAPGAATASAGAIEVEVPARDALVIEIG